MPRTPTPEFSCSDCRREMKVVFDHSTGDMVCSDCGLVLESLYIDETSKWHTFTDDSTNRDTTPRGSPVDPLLMGDGKLITRISKTKRTPTPEFYCSDCRRETEVVFDHSTGDTVCSECGLVLESQCIDETSEWRTFADDLTHRDPTRVGSPVDPLLMGEGELTTRISMAKTKGFNTITGGDAEPNVTWVHGRGAGGDRDRAVVMGFETIANMCDRSVTKPFRVKVEILLGLCLQCIADVAFVFPPFQVEPCCNHKVEICSAANGASKKDIGRAKEFIVKQLAVEMGQSMELGAISAGDYLRRFCSNLGMSSKEVKAVQEAVQKSEAIDIRRAPISIAGAIIYMITQLSDEKKSLKDIALSTSVSEATIRSVYKDLYPYASRIVPNWYASDKDLINNRSARPLLV
ncbi:hypothetical protein RJ640_007096 [Escallonia rubra]|uniref:TFIIB-type domain-containing protein n=1 Tax=Escallonia rubra TaxID=112253 RepID=A0AA88RU04_9ASTE|nr:hypothetical protein RJ640_007096 [Escallonia rubra]